MGHSEISDGLPFGTLGRPHGNTGEISFRPFHLRGWRLDVAALPLEAMIGEPGVETPATVTAIRPIVHGFLLRLEGVSTREGAASLTGRKLWLPRTTLPPLGAGEFYVEDLVGCLVEDREGRSLGVVRGVFWNGSHDVMVIGDGEMDERLLPAVPEFIVAMDRSTKRVMVDPHE
ncbi:MAG TPA: ribosome maturation factor RimM [Polyangia bacterium]|nr:ribosome maturation factor RimM [Polyangia bacterium]